MKKRIYIKPQMRSVLLKDPVLVYDGSNTVSDYTKGSDIMIGDEDESTTARENTWGFWEEEQ